MTASQPPVDTLRLRAAGLSDLGRHRQVNEDSGYLGGRLFAVADGIGGQPYGEVASAMAIAAVAELDSSEPSGDGLSATLHALAQEIAGRLTDAARQQPAYIGMGTTLVALCWTGTAFGVLHIGDSRGYLLSTGALSQITRDHTLIQSLLDDGTVSPEQARQHPRRSVLVHALLTEGMSKPDVFTVPVNAGDRLLLCSDGLSDVLEPAQIAEVLNECADAGEAVRRLVDAANTGGGPDNITCIVVDVLVSQGDSTEPSPVLLGAAARR